MRSSSKEVEDILYMTRDRLFDDQDRETDRMFPLQSSIVSCQDLILYVLVTVV